MKPIPRVLKMLTRCFSPWSGRKISKGGPLFVALAFFATAASSDARLGENLKEIRRRYGQSLAAESTKETKTDRYTFRWEQYTVVVTMQDGLSVSEEFTRWDKRQYTLQEVLQLLRDTVEPGLAWTQVDGSTWKQQDRTATWAGRSVLVQEKARSY